MVRTVILLPRAIGVIPTRVGMVRVIENLMFPDRVIPTRVGMVRASSLTASAAQVIPTRVGMVRAGRKPSDLRPCYPHARGDGPA